MPKKLDKLFLRELRETWDDVNTYGMTEDEAAKFRKQKEAVDLYIDDVSLDIIVSRTGFTKPRVIQLVNRCAMPTETGEIPGYNALIPRKILLPTSTKMDQFFEERPKIGEKIRGTYFGDKAYTCEHRINFRDLHSVFIRECINAGIQKDEYPFTMQDRGYESLRRYITKIANTETMKAIKREGKDQRQQFMSTGFGRAININPRAPFDIVQVDGHILDILTVVTTEDINGVETTDIATRVWLIAVVDVATRCIIGYSMTPYMNYNQFEVLEAIKNSIMPHEHKEFKLKSLPYPENGGFPSEVIPETKWATFNTIMLDNAKSHQAKVIVNKLTNELKCVMNFGSVATPETRGIVERTFQTLSRVIHRLPNTTGSNSRDPKRKDAEKHAMQMKVTYEDLCEIVESIIAEYNNSPHSSLNGLTPLQMMETKIREAHMPFYTIPQIQREKVLRLTHYTKECVLRGGYKNGKQPRVSFESVIYHGLNCRIPLSLCDKPVIIEADPEDLRIVKMYLEDGSYFCDMIAQGEYGRIPHSLRVRKMTVKKRRERMNSSDNPFTRDIEQTHEEFVERGKESRRARTNAANMARGAKGALDRPDEPATIVDFPYADNKSSGVKPRRKAVGDASWGKDEPTLDEIAAAFANNPKNSFAAVQSLKSSKKG